MKRKIFAFLLAACFAVIASGIAACKPTDKPVDDNNFSYAEVIENGIAVGYEVNGLLNDELSALVISASYKGMPVTKIGEQAFADCTQITEVTIPDCVTSIGEKSFYNCENLKSVSFGNGVTQVGGLAFAKCSNIEKVNISDLGAWCEISFENLSANPLYFSSELYINNELVSKLEIPDDVSIIGNYAFYECENITEVVIGNGVTSIGESAFYCCEGLKKATVGNGVTLIKDSAFSGCINLEELVLGEKVITIEDYAFNQCEALKRAVLPSTVETLGECAFSGCIRLESIGLNDGLKSIGSAAFSGCIALKSLIMPDSVTEIGISILIFGASGGFVEGDPHNNLSELVISNSLTEIPDFAFSKSNIVNVAIGQSVQTIRYSAFYGCSLLESVVIPKSVTKIESYAFYRCSSLTKVYYEGTIAEWLAVSVGKNGNDISTAKKFYYSETQPSVSGIFWHYVDGVPTEW